jgi:hypothetical protein
VCALCDCFLRESSAKDVYLPLKMLKKRKDLLREAEATMRSKVESDVNESIESQLTIESGNSIVSSSNLKLRSCNHD